MRILVLENDRAVPAGRFEGVAVRLGHDISFVRLHAGEAIPDLRSFDAVVALGGGMGAYDTDKYPYLVEEKVFLRDAVSRGVPVLGLCLGSQLLADALGGEAYLAPRPEVGLASLTLHVEGDPIADALGSGRLVVFHRDTFDVPPGGAVLASTDGFVHAFRCGSAVAIQPHPEVTPGTLDAWIDDPDSSDILAGAGVTRAEMKAEAASAVDEMAAVAESVFHAWFAEAESAPRFQTTHT